MGLTDSERISTICSAVLIQSTRVTDRDRQAGKRLGSLAAASLDQAWINYPWGGPYYVQNI